MTFRQFLLNEAVESFKEVVERDCMPYLKETGGNGFLRRGIKGLASSPQLTMLDEQRYQTTDLGEAVRGRNEIMVKCGSYYVFPLVYEDDLKKALGLR